MFLRRERSRTDPVATMSHRDLELPDDVRHAVEAVLSASRAAPVVVFKKSPICPVSFRAEDEFRSWLAERPEAAEVSVVSIDVIVRKPLARGLTTELGIEHQSPQALIFRDGALSWHGSHEALTKERFRDEVD